jgi:hypothetical protein
MPKVVAIKTLFPLHLYIKYRYLPPSTMEKVRRLG